MNLLQVKVPLRAVPELNRILFEKNHAFVEGETSFIQLDESDLISLLRLIEGAGPTDTQKNEAKNEEMNIERIGDAKGAVNQEINTPGIKDVVELSRKNAVNRIRAIMELQNLSLKEVAERYGGKSAAANISNFIAKSDEELSNMRPSTKDKLAHALNCPVEWLG